MLLVLKRISELLWLALLCGAIASGLQTGGPVLRTIDLVLVADLILNGPQRIEYKARRTRRGQARRDPT